MIKEDPYASMEKDQLISMIHFLVKREDERAQENQELKDMVKELGEMCGVSTLEYFKEFFKAIMQGRTDYENMLPMTIGIKK